MSLCVALNYGVRYNEFTIKYLEIENHEFQLKTENVFVGVRGFFVFIFKRSNAELFIILKFNCKSKKEVKC